MNRIEITSRPFDDTGSLWLTVTAEGAAFSGCVDVFADREELIDFAARLAEFPTSATAVVEYRYGDQSGQFPAHLRLRAEVRDGVGHSAVHVTARSFSDGSDSGAAEFSIPAEPASINLFGSSLTEWLRSPVSRFEWKPNA